MLDDLASEKIRAAQAVAERTYDPSFARVIDTSTEHRKQTPDTYKVSHANYLETAFNSPQLIVERFERYVMQPRDRGELLVDTIIGTGFSGSLVVPMLAQKFGLHFALLRKDTEKNTSHRMLEGRVGANWIFVDDCTDSHRTWKHVATTMRAWQDIHSWYTTYQGAFWYAYLMWSQRDWFVPASFASEENLINGTAPKFEGL